MRHALAVPIIALAIAVTGPAMAHAKLVGTSPEADATIAESPSEIRLVFNEGVAAALSGIEIAADGVAETTGIAPVESGEADELVFPIAEPLKSGTYRVEWHAVSDDMHRIEGEFRFTVGP